MSIFNKILVKPPKRSGFNLSHEVKLTANFGELIPFLCQPIYPGDKFKVSNEMLLKTMPLLAPIMHRVNVYTHYFFVPNRLLMDDWNDYVTGGKDGNVDIKTPQYILQGDYKHYSKKDAAGNGSLVDYLGFPTPEIGVGKVTDNNSYCRMRVPKFVFNAYAQIWNDYYRDETLDQEIEFSKSNDDVQITFNGTGEAQQRFRFTQLQMHRWPKDYFTSALPWPQRGGSVDIPLNGDIDIEFYNQGRTRVRNANTGYMFTGPGDVQSNNGTLHLNTESNPVQIDNSEQLRVVKENLGFSLNDLRTANALQRWLEKSARGGYRYIEQIFSHFGVKSSDARLQRAEFLGGGHQPVVISEVLQTVEQSSNSPLGQQGGHAMSAAGNFAFKRFFEEHGVLMGIMYIQPKAGYFQGYPRCWSFRDRMEMYWPTYANLGEDAILNKEIFFDFTADKNPEVPENNLNLGEFGYQSRYAHLKTIPDSVHGDFRGNLLFWHLARKFNPSDGKVPLNQEFLTPNINELNRSFAARDLDDGKFYIQIYNNIRASRPMPKFGTPQL